MAYAMKVPAASADDRAVAIYVRVSTGYQVDKDSLPFQKKMPGDPVRIQNGRHMKE